MKPSGRSQQQLRTHYVRTVSGVDQDLVVGVGFPLHLLRAVSSGGLPFAEGRKVFKSMNQTKNGFSVRVQKQSGGSPVGHGRGDVSVVEPGVPRKQDDASVAKHAVEEELRTTTGRNEEIRNAE